MEKVSNDKVIAVIVTYNRKELLKESIEALLNQYYKNLSILIVDNHSTDGTREYIENYINDKKIIYKDTGSNLGGAGGFNFGIKEAYNIGCDYMWIMDDDCIVNQDSLENLVKAAKTLKNNFGFLSSKVLWKDGNICNMNIPKKTFSTWEKDFETNYQKIAMASFVSLFIKSSIVKEFGLPIKEFFIWTDDWEFTRRISRKYNCYYITESIVTHKCKNNIGADISTEEGERLERFKYLYRNDVVLYRGEGIKGWFLFKLRITKHKIKILLSNKSDKKERIRLMNDAIKEGKKFYPNIEYIGDNNV